MAKHTLYVYSSLCLFSLCFASLIVRMGEKFGVCNNIIQNKMLYLPQYNMFINGKIDASWCARIKQQFINEIYYNQFLNEIVII